MKITINDLAFEFSLHEKRRTIDAVNKFISICRRLESVSCHNVERLVRTDIDMTKELYPTGSIYRIIQEISDRDKKKYFLSLLVNRGESGISVDEPFVYKERSSLACAGAIETALVSMETEEGLKKIEISGKIGDKEVCIKNISREDHINYYWNMLGLRIYEANDEKHKKDRENAYGKGKIGSPMDLSDAEAQVLLDHAVLIKNRLYARKGSKNYAFQSTRNCVYHGYIANDLGDDILTVLSGRKWD